MVRRASIRLVAAAELYNAAADVVSVLQWQRDVKAVSSARYIGTQSPVNVKPR